MVSELSFWDYAVFALLLVVSGLVGPFYMWRERRKGPATSESYFMGNRSLKLTPTSASLFASFVSAIALVGVPAELYTAGGRFFMHSFGQAIGIVVGAFLVVPVFYRLKLISSLAYLEHRFGSKALRKVVSGMNIFGSAFYIAIVTYAPCVALEGATGIPLWLGVASTAGITMVYTVLGGMKAVVAVDLIQTIVMFLAIITAIGVGIARIPGGFMETLRVSFQGRRLNFIDTNPDLRNTYSIYTMVIPPILVNAKIFATSQAAIQRYSALKSLREAIACVLTMAPMMLFLNLLLLLFAMAMYTHYEITGCDPLRGGILKSPNQLTTYYVTEIVNFPGFIGIWFAGLFSGSLSTMSTGYNSMSALIWEDFLKDRLEKRLNSTWTSVLMKAVTLIFSAVTCLLAVGFSYFKGTVFQLAIGTGSIFGVSNFIAFITGCLMPFVNVYGAIAGMVSGTFITALLSAGQFMGNRFGVSPTRDWLPTRTDLCFVNCTTTCTSNFTEIYDLNPQSISSAPPFLVYFMSISVFLYPMIAVLFGVIISCIVGISTGGLRSARLVDPKYLVVPNWFQTSAEKLAFSSDVEQESAEISDEEEKTKTRWELKMFPDKKKQQKQPRPVDTSDMIPTK